MNRIFHDCPVPEIFEIDVSQDHANDHHGHSGVAVSNCRYCTVKSKWQWKSRNHQNNSKNTCQNARMCHNLFQSFLFVTGSGKNSQSGGPHHDSLWDQINTGKHQTFCAINSLCDRISKKSRIRADGSILKTFISSFRFFSEHHFSINHTKYLNTYRYKKDFQIFYKISICCTLRKCMKNVARQNQINNKVIDVFLPLWSDDMYFFHQKSYSYKEKDREL